MAGAMPASWQAGLSRTCENRLRTGRGSVLKEHSAPSAVSASPCVLRFGNGAAYDAPGGFLE